MHKLWAQIYDRIVYNEDQIEMIKQLEKEGEGPIIFCPTHRSYIDFLIVSYICFNKRIKVPHICAGEDFLNIAVVHHLLRQSGAFFMRRSFKDDPLYKVIFTQYLSMLLQDGHSLEFFVEGTRSRVGKMLQPKHGFLKFILENYFSEKVSTFKFVPVTINYSRVLEGETFPMELLGEKKVGESLGRVLNAFRYMNMNFGKIYINFS